MSLVLYDGQRRERTCHKNQKPDPIHMCQLMPDNLLFIALLLLLPLFFLFHIASDVCHTASELPC